MTEEYQACPVNPISSEEQSDLKNRFTYHAPKGTQQVRYEALRLRAFKLAELIMRLCPHSRERSLALTKLQATTMWANASIACNE